MSAPVRSGKKDPSLLLEVKRPAAQGETAPVYVVGTKPIKHRGEILAPGTPVPDAAEWPRLEGKLRARTLVRL